MNRQEYQLELQSIQRCLDRKTEKFFEYRYWNEKDLAPRCIGTALYALVETLIARELYHISQEESRECGECEKRRECYQNKKEICHKDEKEVTQ